MTKSLKFMIKKCLELADLIFQKLAITILEINKIVIKELKLLKMKINIS